MDKAIFDEMFRMERQHWWFAARRKIILHLLQKYLHTKAPVVYDVGCGCGMMIYELIARGWRCMGMDSDDAALEYCRMRGSPAIQGSLSEQMPLPGQSADAVLLLDVLEHVDDDKKAFAAAVELLRPGGIIICTVPAYKWLWTKRDEFHHHKRRYSKKYLREVLNSTTDIRTSVELLSYINCFLFPLAIMQRLINKILPSKMAGDLTIPPTGINRILEMIFASEGPLLAGGVMFPFGLSLLAVVRKPHKNDL